MNEHVVQLTEKQQEAVDTVQTNLQIIACAGSGKTEVIARRISNILSCCKEIRPMDIVAFTFTNKAAASLKNRVRMIVGDDSIVEDMKISTIHSFCSDVLRKNCPEYAGFSVLDSVKNYHFVCKYRDRCGLTELGLSSSYHDIRCFLECMDKLVDDFANKETWCQEWKTAFDTYRDCLYKHNFFDFRFLLLECVEQATKEDSLKNALSQIRYLTVDEYQDINDIQEKLIQIIAGYGANICVVGDDDQTIYRFRGSNADNMISFSDRYSDVKRVILNDNFRCSSDVISLASTVIDNNENRIKKRMCPRKNAPTGKVECIKCASSYEQYKVIAEGIQDIIKKDGMTADIAVLVRKNKYISEIARELRNHGILYSTEDSSYLFKSPYYRMLSRTLIILESPNYEDIKECWGEVLDAQLLKQAFRNVRGEKGALAHLLEKFSQEANFLDKDKDDYPERCEAYETVKCIASDIDAVYDDYQLSSRIGIFRKFIEQGYAELEYEHGSFKEQSILGVQIMTIHKAKGLEFDNVFIPEMENGEFPSGSHRGKTYRNVLGKDFGRKYESDMEDERKLFYVAATRAKLNICFTYSLGKKGLSDFLKEGIKSGVMDIPEGDAEYVFCAQGKNQKAMISVAEEEPEEKEDIEKEREEREHYQKMVSKVRSGLSEFYGTETHFVHGMYL